MIHLIIIVLILVLSFIYLKIIGIDQSAKDDDGLKRFKVNVRRPDSSIVKGVSLGKLRMKFLQV